MVQKLFAQLLEDAGLTDEKLALRISEGIDAKEIKLAQKMASLPHLRQLFLPTAAVNVADID